MARRPCQAPDCRSWALETGWCWRHCPTRADERRAAAAKGGRVTALHAERRKLSTPKALVQFVSGLMLDTLAGRVDPKVCNALINAANAQRALLESSELEARLSALEARQPRQPNGRQRWGA